MADRLCTCASRLIAGACVCAVPCHAMQPKAVRAPIRSAMHRRNDEPDMETCLRSSADYDSDLLDAVADAGEGVEVLEDDAGEGMSLVRTADGSEGWLRTEHLKPKTPRLSKVQGAPRHTANT